MKAVVIIPTYNEKENIKPLTKQLEEVFREIKDWDLGILFVDGNSPDGTSEEVKIVAKDYKNIELLVETKKGGLGAAYLNGMEYAFSSLKADVVFEFDADLSHDATKIPIFIKRIEEGYDMVLGSRYIPGGGIPDNWGIHRKLLSVVGNMVANIVMTDFRIRDWTGGFRAIKKWVFEEFKDKIKDKSTYSFQVQSLYFARAAKAKIVEVPFHFVDRIAGKSKMPKIAFIKSALFFLLDKRFWEIAHSRFMKFAIVGFIGYLINAFGLEFFFRLGLSAGLAAGVGAELAIVSNFILNNLWTFSEQKIQGIKNILLKFVHFNVTSFGAVIIQTVVVGILAKIFGNQWRQIYLVIAIAFFVIPYNYTMYNLFIWHTWKLPKLLK